MEKAAVKSKNNKFLKFLPRAASAVVSFQNPPCSPDKKRSSEKLRIQDGKGFSGPVVSIIPAEARRKLKNNSSSSTRSFEAEPSSPKVSCMGQIKHKKKISMKHTKKLTKEESRKPPLVSTQFMAAKEKNTLRSFRSVLSFSGAKVQGRKSDVSADRSVLPDRAPSLSQMRRFASGRDSIRNFDWAAQVRPVDADPGSYYYSDDEDGEGEEREVIIPFSAPLMVGGGGGGGCGTVGIAMEPKKEINLWKRRTMAQPRPLQVT